MLRNKLGEIFGQSLYYLAVFGVLKLFDVKTTSAVFAVLVFLGIDQATNALRLLTFSYLKRKNLMHKLESFNSPTACKTCGGSGLDLTEVEKG